MAVAHAAERGKFRRMQSIFSRAKFSVRWLIAAVTLLSLGRAEAQQRYLIGNPSGEQQYMLELINRARADGGAEATRLGLSGLQEGPPTVAGEPWTIENSVQPLSWNPLLAEAAQTQAENLNAADQFFLGISPHTFGGKTPDERIADTGYDAATYNGPTTASGFYPGQENVAEEVSQGLGGYTGDTLTAAILGAHNNLFTDLNTPGRGHRETIMLGFFRDVGIGVSVGKDNAANPGQPNGAYDSLYIVQEAGTQVGQSPLITGVVYNDANGNNFYDAGEGIGGVRVDVPGSGYYALTTSSGGYTVPVLGNGSYNVTFSGPVMTYTQTVTVFNLENAKVDYVSAAAAPTLLANISTRLLVQTGNNVLIGGFIVNGSGRKTILIRAIGPSLPLSGSLANPTLELYDGSGRLLEVNDNWQDSPDQQAISETGIAPNDDMEAAILRAVDPGLYTAVVRGAGGTSGVGLVEMYDVTPSIVSELANISTRGQVSTGDNVLIGGTIITGVAAQKVIVRALGPSLNLPGSLANPSLELYDGNGEVIAANDDWRTDQEDEIMATLPPPNDLEAAIVATLMPGPYTAIVRGSGGGTGIVLVEFYALDN